MEKISAEIAAAEEAARKRVADREKDAGERSAREAPACVLAEEEKHICATHGTKSQQTPHGDGDGKQSEGADPNSADGPGEPGRPLSVHCLIQTPAFHVLCFLQGRSRPQRTWKFIPAVRRGCRRTRRASRRESWRRGPATATRARRPPPRRRRTRRPASRQRRPVKPGWPTETRAPPAGSTITLPGHVLHRIIPVCRRVPTAFRRAGSPHPNKKAEGLKRTWQEKKKRNKKSP